MREGCSCRRRTSGMRLRVLAHRMCISNRTNTPEFCRRRFPAISLLPMTRSADLINYPVLLQQKPQEWGATGTKEGGWRGSTGPPAVSRPIEPMRERPGFWVQGGPESVPFRRYNRGARQPHLPPRQWPTLGRKLESTTWNPQALMHL